MTSVVLGVVLFGASVLALALGSLLGRPLPRGGCGAMRDAGECCGRCPRRAARGDPERGA